MPSQISQLPLISKYQNSIDIPGDHKNKHGDKKDEYYTTGVVFAAGYFEIGIDAVNEKNYILTVFRIVKNFLDMNNNSEKYNLVIYGYADETQATTTDKGNLALSYKRAVNTIDMFKDEIMRKDKISFKYNLYIKGFGDTKVSDYKEERDKWKNRRVEIGIIPSQAYLVNLIKQVYP
jgi:flagellar motor protein MotB